MNFASKHLCEKLQAAGLVSYTWEGSKMNKDDQIKEACAWMYQKVASVFLNNVDLTDSEQTKILDILSDIASGDDFEVPE